MHGLTEHEEIDYWRKRCEQAERELAKYAAVVQAAREWRNKRGPGQSGSLTERLEQAIDALDSKEQSK